MPKRCLSILFVAFAVVSLLVMRNFPHHHHDEATVCFATECCKDRHDGGGEHAHRHHSGLPGYDRCLVDDSYLFSSDQQETKCKAESSHHDHRPHAHLFFALSCLAAVASQRDAENTDPSPEYGEGPVRLYPSFSTSRDNGLRAPPPLSV